MIWNAGDGILTVDFDPIRIVARDGIALVFGPDFSIGERKIGNREAGRADAASSRQGSIG